MLKNLSNYFGLQNLTKLKKGVLRDLREKMFSKIISLPVSYYSEKRKGDVMARMLGDVNEVQNSFFMILELIVKEPLTIIFSLIAMISISWKLTIFVFIFIPISGLVISVIGKSLKGKSTRAQQENGYLISITEETLSGLKVVKGYNAENYFSKIFNDSINRLYNLTNAIAKKNNLASPMSEFMGIVVIGVLLIYGGNLVLVEGSLKGSDFIAYIGLAYNILTPAKAISKASYQVKNGMAAAERVFEILDTPNVIQDTDRSLNLNTFNDLISIKNVTFSYNGEYNVLKNFNLEIPKGKTVALVGQSGSGKSTIANLLLRFYDVEQGELLIDGTNIKDIKLVSLRDQLGLVTQDSIMFNGSIADNVRIGKLNATDDEVIAALKIANAYEFVQNLSRRNQYKYWRWRRKTFGRTKTTYFYCACRVEKSTDYGFRRSNIGIRYRKRTFGTGCAGKNDGKPYIGCYCPQIIDHSKSRFNCGYASWRNCRTRYTRRTVS